MVALLSVSGIFAAFLSWLDGLSDNRAQLVLGLLLIALPLIGAFGGWALRKAWAAIRRRRNAAQQKRAEEEADFLRGPAELGIFDHGVNSIEALNAIKDGIVGSLPLMTAISSKVLFGDVAKRLNETAEAAPRAEISRTLARDLHLHVRGLEQIAHAIEPKSLELVSSYRVLFQKTDLSAAECAILKDTRDVFTSGVPVFTKVSETCALLRKRLAPVAGKQEDLTRIISRAIAAIKVVEEVVNEVIAFSSGEMVQTIDSILDK